MLHRRHQLMQHAHEGDPPVARDRVAREEERLSGHACEKLGDRCEVPRGELAPSRLKSILVRGVPLLFVLERLDHRTRRMRVPRQLAPHHPFAVHRARRVAVQRGEAHASASSGRLC
eukprot:scaffold23661_cov75-Phaeocystis_antarctica.AAC.3